MKQLFLALSIAVALSSSAQNGLLLGMGAGYASKTIYGELVVGYKANKTALYYNQVALLSADQPAYFGLATSYDALVKEDYKITLSAGYYFRKQSSDVKGKAGGNYNTVGGSIAYNREWFSVVVRYIDNNVQAGVLLSGLLTGSRY